ncbi:hypothetical protein CEXT_321941 [Caerostris extrusa]|uniref:Uncharacterized protein n=1 Tax=Caerostris extrusa TaxID=172846 RepID=A0AAV4QKU0_CAEEX|nr:hypothetical protein CEXT_321941 [Caerostris extrusa]
MRLVERKEHKREKEVTCQCLGKGGGERKRTVSNNASSSMSERTRNEVFRVFRSEFHSLFLRLLSIDLLKIDFSLSVRDPVSRSEVPPLARGTEDDPGHICRSGFLTFRQTTGLKKQNGNNEKKKSS